jgi:hypothetical protein
MQSMQREITQTFQQKWYTAVKSCRESDRRGQTSLAVLTTLNT